VTPIGVTIAATCASLLLLLAVLELVRRRRLREKYALLWLLTAVVLLILSIWRGAVDSIASLVGVGYAPAIIFAIAFLFVLVVLLHYSTVVSNLADRTVWLTQQIALLEQRIRDLEQGADVENKHDHREP